MKKLLLKIFGYLFLLYLYILLLLDFVLTAYIIHTTIKNPKRLTAQSYLHKL